MFGGFLISDFGGTGFTLSIEGAQLFSGLPSDPTFLTGVFELEAVSGVGNYTLTIASSNGPGVIPEPASWAMMIAGFGLVGGAMRRRNSAVQMA